MVRKEEVKDDDPIAEIKAARAARESREATTSPSDYSVSIENGRMVVNRNPDPMVSAVGPAPAITQRGPDDAEGRRADYEILKDQGYNPENMQYYSREKFEDEKAAIAAGVAQPSAYAQEVTDAKAARTAEEIELEGYPANVQASGYYHREGTPEGYPALQPRTERPVSDPIQELLQKQAAQEGLSQMRETLYGNFAQPGDYDPRLPGAIEAIRGQLGQVPPLGREPESEKIRRNMDIQGQLGNLMPRTPANPDEYPALMERTSPPSRKLKAGNNWWVRGGNPEPAQMSGDVSRRSYHR